MRSSLLVALSAMALLPFTTSLVKAGAPSVSATSVWLVTFDEPPLASFHGPHPQMHAKLQGLQATSPAALSSEQLDVSTPQAQAYRAALSEVRHEHLVRLSQRAGRKLEPLFEYDVVNHGVALSLTDDEAKRLAGDPRVAHITPDRALRPMTDAGPSWIKAPSVWEGTYGQNPYRGEGQIIAVIDTGIVPTHPSFQPMSGGYLIKNPRAGFLGLCGGARPTPGIGCNAKLIGIYDMTTGQEDSETNNGRDVDSHGTHVAATVAGNPTTATINGVSYEISGVAPRANIISYKVCEAKAKCQTSWTVAAINRAVEDRVSVINFSIGGDPVDPWSDPLSRAMLGAREAGVVVVVAAGNDGPGANTLTWPSNAPWVLSVANASHDRAMVSRVQLQGGDTAPPHGGLVFGASLTNQAYGPAALVQAASYGSSLCATGRNVDALPPDTSTNPWRGSTPFAGEIVVCERGTFARLIKGLNVKLGGGGGMLLLNTALDGAGVVADAHELPASNLPYSDSVALKRWLATGSNHQATISASSVERVPAFADVLSASSGRGSLAAGFMKPNVAAPGSNIIAAAVADANGNVYRMMSGTSMASPHVAGAAALLRGRHPSWGPSEVESALQLTSHNALRIQDGLTPATMSDVGAGTVDLSHAVRLGLSFPVSGTEFRNATTSQLKQTLNLPSLVSSGCLQRCTFTRTVKDLVGGSRWRVEPEIPGAEVTVTPAQFTLAAGASQRLEVVYTPTAEARFGRWQEGRIRLVETTGKASDLLIPVAVIPQAGNLPSEVVLPTSGGTVSAESGWVEASFQGLVALPSARFLGTNLVAPLQVEALVDKDSTPDDRYDTLSGFDNDKKVFRIKASESGLATLYSRLSATTAQDAEVFIGRSEHFSVIPSAATFVCRSRATEIAERCDSPIQVTAGEEFWVLIQRRGGSVAEERMSLEAAVLPLNSDKRSLVVTGPGTVATNEAFSVRLAWRDFSFLPGETRWGQVIIGASDKQPEGIGRVVVRLTRDAEAHSAALALTPETPLTLSLRPAQAQERLYLDVPPNTQRLRVSSQGEGQVSLYLAHEPSPSSPVIDKAPERARAAASATQAGANKTVTVSGSALKSGRWYVTPVNTGSTTAKIELRVSLDYGATRPHVGYGNWYDPTRSGSGFFISPYDNGAIWTVAWYTYLQDGTPTWYVGSVPAPAANQGAVNFELYRMSWDGQRSHGVIVGEASLSVYARNEIVVSFNLDGESGSQRLFLIEAAGNACEPLAGTDFKVDGNWHVPTRTGFGFQVLSYANPNSEIQMAYVYDGQGLPRWLMAHRDDLPITGSLVDMPVSLLTGSCPLCTFIESAGTEIGLAQRKFINATQGRMGVDVTFPSPMRGVWKSLEDVTMLTSAVSCQ